MTSLWLHQTWPLGIKGSLVAVVQRVADMEVTVDWEAAAATAGVVAAMVVIGGNGP